MSNGLARPAKLDGISYLTKQYSDRLAIGAGSPIRDAGSFGDSFSWAAGFSFGGGQVVTILEYLWQNDRMTVLRLLGLALLGGRIFEEIIHEPAPRIVAPSPFGKLMRHDAYRRGKGGAIRQVRWA